MPFGSSSVFGQIYPSQDIQRVFNQMKDFYKRAEQKADNLIYFIITDIINKIPEDARCPSKETPKEICYCNDYILLDVLSWYIPMQIQSAFVDSDLPEWLNLLEIHLANSTDRKIYATLIAHKLGLATYLYDPESGIQRHFMELDSIPKECLKYIKLTPMEWEEKVVKAGKEVLKEAEGVVWLARKLSQM